MNEIMSLSKIVVLLQQYASPAAGNSAKVQRGFEQVAQTPSEHFDSGIAEATGSLVLVVSHVTEFVGLTRTEESTCHL